MNDQTDLTLQQGRTLLKRIALWTAAVMLAFAGYLASAPMVVVLVMPRFPAIIPVLYVAYGPLDYLCVHSEYPGSRSYGAYAEWCRERLEPPPPVILMPPPQRALPNEGIPAP